jgi:hypothetical protein
MQKPSYIAGSGTGTLLREDHRSLIASVGKAAAARLALIEQHPVCSSEKIEDYSEVSFCLVRQASEGPCKNGRRVLYG